MYRSLILLVGLFMGTYGFAASDSSDPYSQFSDKSDYNEDLEIPWVEFETRVRQLPQDKDLVPVRMLSLPQGMQLFVDIENAVLLDDRVTRLWLVVRSSSGAYNGSYEALRCATHEYKVYAYGNPKRARPVRTVNLPGWREVRSGKYRNELMSDYFCDGVTQRSLDSVKQSLGRDFSQDDPINEVADF